MSISVGLFALFLLSAFVLGMITTPLIFYLLLISPTKIHTLAHEKNGNR